MPPVWIGAVIAAALGQQPGNGVTLKTYSNLALAGTPESTQVLSSASVSLPGDKPFSAELVGTIGFPAAGAVFHFDCNWTGTTMGFVWVDGHMVCQDGHAYRPGAGTTDNPLPVNVLNRSKGLVSSLPFRAHIYYSPGSQPPPPPPPPPLPDCNATSIGTFDDRKHKCGFNMIAPESHTGNRWELAAGLCFEHGYTVAGAQASLGQEIWCGHTSAPDCPKSQQPGVTCPGNHTETCGGDYLLELIQFTCKPRASRTTPNAQLATVGVSIGWAPLTAEAHSELLATANREAAGPASGSTAEVADRMLAALPHTVIPVQALGPTLPVVEAQRDKLQRALANGWGSWLHGNKLPIVKLPDAATITAAVCSKSAGTCVSSAIPDGARPHPRNRPGVETRVGHHAFDRSYVQFFFGGGDTPGRSANVSVEYSVSGDGNADIDLLLTPQAECGGNCSDFAVQLSGRYAWLKTGGINASSSGAAGTGMLLFTPAGCAPVTLYATGAATASSGSALTVGFDSDAVGFSTTKGATVTSIAAKLAAARAAEVALLVKTFGADRAGEGQAVKASAMWTLTSTPAENGGAPLLPVSAVWNFAPGPANADFTYAIFDWDNLFATLLAASGAPNATDVGNDPEGERPWGGYGWFVPNFAAGGLRSQDRTEPPIGAKVLSDLVKKFGADRMGWVVTALFDDLLDWNDWFIRKRLKPPLYMVALGTFNDQTHEAGNMQDARYESGLDNSPMYDGTFVNTTNGCSLYESGCGLMQLYDVGMTSMFVQEAFALAELAPLAGKPSTMSEMLTARGKAMAQKISDHLWDDGKGIFVNRFSADHNGGSFYEHVSPTSFYAMQAHAATDEQAATMAENWLLNSSRFCIAPGGDYKGLQDSCYWGLPSIEASDPAYPPLGYWRGYIWGPQVQLTFWSLQNYDHVPQVRAARKAMCKQLAGLMMSQWNMHRHICENYNPHRTADTTGGDCSGTRFYHWGGLTGLIGLMEDGLF